MRTPARVGHTAARAGLPGRDLQRDRPRAVQRVSGRNLPAADGPDQLPAVSDRNVQRIDGSGGVPAVPRRYVQPERRFGFMHAVSGWALLPHRLDLGNPVPARPLLPWRIGVTVVLPGRAVQRERWRDLLSALPTGLLLPSGFNLGDTLPGWDGEPQLGWRFFGRLLALPGRYVLPARVGCAVALPGRHLPAQHRQRDHRRLPDVPGGKLLPRILGCADSVRRRHVQREYGVDQSGGVHRLRGRDVQPDQRRRLVPAVSRGQLHRSGRKRIVSGLSAGSVLPAGFGIRGALPVGDVQSEQRSIRVHRMPGRVVLPGRIREPDSLPPRNIQRLDRGEFVLAVSGGLVRLDGGAGLVLSVSHGHVQPVRWFARLPGVPARNVRRAGGVLVHRVRTGATDGGAGSRRYRCP